MCFVNYEPRFLCIGDEHLGFRGLEKVVLAVGYSHVLFWQLLLALDVAVMFNRLWVFFRGLNIFHWW